MAKSNDPDKDILEAAKEFFQQASSAESEMRIERLDDLKFVRSGDQWPEWAKADRSKPGAERPMLTINRLQQFANRVKNDLIMNTIQGRVAPEDDLGDVKTAELMNGLLRHIQAKSNAAEAYQEAASSAVDTGVGYFKISHDFVTPTDFDQEIRIEPIIDTFKVYFDPNSIRATGEDAMAAMIVEEMSKSSAEQKYGKDLITPFVTAGTGDGWVTEDTIRIGLFYRLEPVTKELAKLQDGTTAFLGDLPPGMEEMVIGVRKVQTHECKWYLIGGDKVLDRGDFPAPYIPIIRVTGQFSVIEGKVHVSGLIRPAKDPQRQFNFAQSAITEALAMSPKAPYVLAAGQIDGFEQYWNSANRVNYPYLPYNPVTVQGAHVPPPHREPFPGVPVGYQQLMIQAVDDMKSTMGLFDASLGASGNETSGTAIARRQGASELGTAHYQNNLANSVRHAMKIILAMIPKVYDTPRIVRILDIDGSQKKAKIDVNAPAPIQDDGVQEIFNPTLGKYDLSVEVGPAYNTKRQEAAASMQELVHAYPDMMAVAGDLIVSNFDWFNAAKMAERLKLMLPPPVQKALEAEKQGQSPEMAQAVAAMEKMQQDMEQIMQQAEQLKAELDDKQAELSIKQYEAETKRMQAMKAEGGEMVDPAAGEAEFAKVDLERMKLEQEAWEAEEKLKIEWFNAETARLKLDIDAKKAERDAQMKEAQMVVSAVESDRAHETGETARQEAREDKKEELKVKAKTPKKEVN